MKVQLTRDVKAPCKGTSKSAAYDFFIPNDWFNDLDLHESVDRVLLYPRQRILIPSGVIVRVPPGCALLFVNKSSIGSKGVLAGAQLVDEDFQGELKLNVINCSDEIMELKPGMKLMQAMIIALSGAQVEVVESAWGDEVTERGVGAYGSTGTGIDDHPQAKERDLSIEKQNLINEIKEDLKKEITGIDPNRNYDFDKPSSIYNK